MNFTRASQPVYVGQEGYSGLGLGVYLLPCSGLKGAGVGSLSSPMCKTRADLSGLFLLSPGWLGSDNTSIVYALIIVSSEGKPC